MASHWLEPTRENLRGTFSRDFPPVLTVESGDRIVCSTLDPGWNVGPPEPFEPGVSPPKMQPRDPESDAGHCLLGPIAIRGAKPGMTLEVRILEVTPGAWGWTVSGGWPHVVHQRLGTHEGPEARLLWRLDADKAVGTDQLGRQVSLRPFLGVMGMPADVPGLQPTPPPRRTGGNLDCKELVPGSSLFLPIEVEGGLLSIGDGHALQADGEACVTAIECGMKRVELEIALHDGPLASPRARLQGAWLTLGLDEDLTEATYKALEAMVDLMGELHGLERKDALALASLCADLRVTQIVNGVVGGHCVLRDDAIRFSG